MTIKAILHGKGEAVTTINASATVAEAIAVLSDQRIGALPVVERGAVRGIFSERDVIYAVAKRGASALRERVGDVMTAPAQTVSLETAVHDALSLMTQRRIRHLPVVDGGDLIGLVSIGDLVKYRIDNIEAEASAMRDYIQTA
jgi:CBS domain-containing protein